MKIAINGFGRIGGRITLRSLQSHPEVDVVAWYDNEVGIPNRIARLISLI